MILPFVDFSFLWKEMNPLTEGDRCLPTSAWRPLVLVAIPISSFGQARLHLMSPRKGLCSTLYSYPCWPSGPTVLYLRERLAEMSASWQLSNLRSEWVPVVISKSDGSVTLFSEQNNSTTV